MTGTLRNLVLLGLAMLTLPGDVQAQWRQEPLRFEMHRLRLEAPAGPAYANTSTSATATLPVAPTPDRPPHAFPARRQAEVADTTARPLGLLMLAGVGGGAAGLFLGEEIGNGVAGALFGETLGIPLGVAAANGFRGSLLADAFASTGIGALGLLMALALNDNAPAEVMLVAIPAAQVLFTAMTEHRTTR